MDGIHDLGGKRGYGPIDVGELPEPFHYSWEARLLGIVRGMTRPVAFSIDRFRHIRECIEPDEYLNRRYYDQWLLVYEAVMLDGGAVTMEELATGKSARPLEGMPPPQTPDKVVAAKRAMGKFDRPSEIKPAFAQGDEVTTNAHGKVGHTRLPQYARGRTGRIEAFRGHHVLPDTNMAGDGPAEPLYCVSFVATELWGEEAAGRTDRVYLDLWESYLERA